MGRILAVLVLSFLVAVCTASARILQQGANEPKVVRNPSALGDAIQAAKTTANVSLFIAIWELGGQETEVALQTTCSCWPLQ